LRVTAAAPAKIILTGEHFVVYGEPAIVIAVSSRAYVTVEERGDRAIDVVSDLGLSCRFVDGVPCPGSDARAVKVLEPFRIAAESVLRHVGVKRGLSISVKSEIPTASGLGSSAAVAVATVAAVGKLLGARLSLEDIARLPFDAESYVHVKPSGADQTISTYGGVLVYRRGSPPERLDIRTEIPLVIGNTGIPRITGQLVAAVRQRRDRFPSAMDAIIKVGGQVTSLALEALTEGDMVRFGELLDINHGLLQAIGVSNKPLDDLVYASKRAGALGAKLSGAGGGGCMFAISRLGEEERIANAIRQAGGIPLTVSKAERGVEVWEER
jgi:mevalonate kinase